MPVSPEDLFLSADLTEDQACVYLHGIGVADPPAADRALQTLADDPAVREALAQIAAPLFEAASVSADPGAALAGFARYVEARSSRTGFLRHLRDDPRGIDVLCKLTGASPVLSEMLIRAPEQLPWLTTQVEKWPPDPAELIDEAEALAERSAGPAARADAIRRLQRREILRTASRDLLEKDSVAATMGQLSDLAEVVIGHALRWASEAGPNEGTFHWPEAHFAVIAFGSLGAMEVGYAGDLDLLLICEGAHAARHRVAQQRFARAVMAELARCVDESYRLRVGRLVPGLGTGETTAYTIDEVRAACEDGGYRARLALAPARVVAGSRGLGDRFIQWARAFSYGDAADGAEPRLALARASSEADDPLLDDLRHGPGGTGQVEHLATAMQLAHGATRPDVRTLGTFAALDALTRAGTLAGDTRDALASAYRFLRAVEHRLQLTVDPVGSPMPHRLRVCARGLGFADAEALEREIRNRRDLVLKVAGETARA